MHRPAIVLEDNELVGSETSKALWARHCSVSDYVVVSGGGAKVGLGAYVVWNCRIDTLDVSSDLFHWSYLQGGRGLCNAAVLESMCHMISYCVLIPS